MNMNMIRHFFV